jgi:hypothetical protein
VAGLVADAESLVSDVSIAPALSALADTLRPGAPWPVPGVWRGDRALEVDWGAIAGLAPRASAEDARALRGLSRAAGPGGEPAWLQPPGDGARGCVRLAETRWAEVALGLQELQASQAEVFTRRAASLRERLVSTLQDVSRGKPVCACAKGDLARALDALTGGKERRGTPEHRALVSAASAAAQAVRSGAARVSFLRDAPGAPAKGCAGVP